MITFHNQKLGDDTVTVDEAVVNADIIGILPSGLSVFRIFGQVFTDDEQIIQVGNWSVEPGTPEPIFEQWIYL